MSERERERETKSERERLREIARESKQERGARENGRGRARQSYEINLCGLPAVSLPSSEP
ncbi:hypothetical protein ANANG_G00100970 [Anguilla anguilla]|uniref:Uncharacterized protein n=1 Tax=Anguilla anguilla TaxID=7936 RepID=A0A9D3MLW4_ANGAN|nr:hypothetical protein ANANG_G00100970 [Anguilla anguilla]